ncbi:MAG: Co2+/Mg2+ efflux protein ApaG [Saprospiraceae bacterium]|nr:Co2+/Mg2+ efflux protein ApaG [Saprospiraceae bacterium]
METKITQGIRISVAPHYEALHSKPGEEAYVYSYRVIIENRRTDTVQLLERHWYIVDGVGQIREVQGPGVVGVQPILPPGERYEYQSWCPFKTDIGRMWGNYLFRRQVDGSIFIVIIPAFSLIPPFKFN